MQKRYPIYEQGDHRIDAADFVKTPWGEEWIVTGFDAEDDQIFVSLGNAHRVLKSRELKARWSR